MNKRVFDTKHLAILPLCNRIIGCFVLYYTQQRRYMDLG